MRLAHHDHITRDMNTLCIVFCVVKERRAKLIALIKYDGLQLNLQPKNIHIIIRRRIIIQSTPPTLRFERGRCLRTFYDTHSMYSSRYSKFEIRGNPNPTLRFHKFGLRLL